MAKEVVSKTADSQMSPEAPPAKRAALWSRILGVFLRQREATIFVIAVGLVGYFQASSSNFLQQQNIGLISQYTAETAIIAVGEVMLLICGEIDVSVGSVYELAPFIMYFAVVNNGFSLPLALIVGLLVSLLVGLFNGIVVVYLGVPSLIATLGTLLALNGITLTISNDFQVLTPGTGTKFASIMGNSTYSEIFWAIGIALVMQLILSRTRWGLHTFAVGGNPLGASEVGVNIQFIKIRNFMLCSLLGGFAGILDAFRITAIQPNNGGTTIMFHAVAGAVIGGTALKGGSGTVVGAFLGVLVLGLLEDGFTFLGVNANTFDIVIGAAILIAMIMNLRLQALREAGRE